MQTILVFGDLQYPYHDAKVWAGCLAFIKQVKPDTVIFNGDGFDFYGLSKYGRDPDRRFKLQDEVDGFQREVLKPIKAAVPEKAWLYYNEGNHEQRLQKYLWGEAPELASLRALNVVKLLGLKEYGFRYRLSDSPVLLGRHLVVAHGLVIRQHSAYTARAHFDRFGSSMVIGHSHRWGLYARTDLRGVHEVIETGCLADLNPEYDPHPNWQQGWAVIHLFPNGEFSTQLVKVINQAFYVWGGKITCL